MKFTLYLLVAACLATASAALALDPNPIGRDTQSVELPPADRDLTGYTDYDAWRALFEHSLLAEFEEFASGTMITDQLVGYGVGLVDGSSINGETAQYVYSSLELPFPMFTVGTLPSETNFLANNWDPPIYCTGEIVFELGWLTGAIGAYIADGAPLDGFAIEVFDGDTSLGTITVPPRTLPAEAFIGIYSDTWFDKARFYATNETDSWGLDNLEIMSTILPTASATWSQLKALFR